MLIFQVRKLKLEQCREMPKITQLLMYRLSSTPDHILLDRLNPCHHVSAFRWVGGVCLSLSC